MIRFVEFVIEVYGVSSSKTKFGLVFFVIFCNASHVLVNQYWQSSTMFVILLCMPKFHLIENRILVMCVDASW